MYCSTIIKKSKGLKMTNIVIGTKVKISLLDTEYDLQVLPLSPSLQMELVGEEYLSKAQRLEALEKESELTEEEKAELGTLRKELSEQMEDISLRKLGYMVKSKDKGDFIATIKELNLASYVVEKLEEALKKSNNSKSK